MKLHGILYRILYFTAENGSFLGELLIGNGGNNFHNFLHICIVVGGVSDDLFLNKNLSNGEQLLALNSDFLRILHLLW